MSKAAPFRRITTVLRQRTYGTYTAGNALSLMGTWMQRIAVGWLAWELTESAAWLGVVAFADLFPMRGRVLSLYGLVFRGGPAFGALLMGPIADSLGLAWPVAAGSLVLALAAMRLMTRLRRLSGHLLADGSSQGERGG